MRTYLQGEVTKIPASKYFKEVKKKYIERYDDPSSVKECNDKLWLLSASEVVNTGYNGGSTRGYAITTEGEEYKYYENVSNSWGKSCSYRMKFMNGVDTVYWLRSPQMNSGDFYCHVNNSGDMSSGHESIRYDVGPGFAI